MNVSFNEIETLSKRAASGAGYSWGLADEAGKATRWLMAYGFPGVEILLEILREKQISSGVGATPVFADGIWQSQSGSLCPLVAGAILCDRAAQITEDNGIRFSSVHQPLALAPYATIAARISNAVFELSWDNTIMMITAHDAAFTTGNAALEYHAIADVRCRRVGHVIANPIKRVTDCTVDGTAWPGLNEFAHRMFAPASEASRLAGAGAGITDND